MILVYNKMWKKILLPLSILARLTQSEGQYEDDLYDALADKTQQKLNILDYLDPYSHRTSTNYHAKEPFKLSDVDSLWHRALPWNGTWVSDTEYIYQNGDGLQITSVATGQSRTLVPLALMIEISKYELSPDQTQVLLMTKEEKLTHHMVATVYNVRSGRLTPLQPDLGVEFAADVTMPSLPVSYALWAPVGSGLVYVYGNNIYYRMTPQSPDVMITTSGTFAVTA